MKLIEPLVSGISVAATGTVVLHQRGSSTRVNYYKDFEASQVYSAQPIALDSSGSAVLYVSQLVDVLVYDSSGTLVREFVAGDNDASVEVISPSFTGTSYSDGSSGANKPTTLENVLDAWVVSAGAPDFNVIPSGGTKLTLSQATAALSSVYFNVRTYGALGNGVTDDSVAIIAAYTAAGATSTGGGTVLFPPGTYRCATTLNWPDGVAMAGTYGSASKLMFDGTGGQNLNLSPGTKGILIQGMYISAQTTATASTILRVITAGRLQVLDCTIGGDTPAQGNCLQMLISGGITTFERCSFRSAAGGIAQVSQNSQSILRFEDCDFINLQATGIAHILAYNGLLVKGCYFAADSVIGAATQYINWSTDGGVYGAPVVVGCNFADGVGGVPTAIYNGQATPQRDVIESDNTFGIRAGTGLEVQPYGQLTDGYAPVTTGKRMGFHGSRLQHSERLVTSVAAADAKVYGQTTMVMTLAGAASITATKGILGDMWTLQVINTTGGGITVTPDAAVIVLDGGVASFNVLAGGRSQRTFAWLPQVSGATPGRWTQVAPATNL